VADPVGENSSPTDDVIERAAEVILQQHTGYLTVTGFERAVARALAEAGLLADPRDRAIAERVRACELRTVPWDSTAVFVNEVPVHSAPALLAYLLEGDR
jgi:hypothetical protein